MKKVLIAADEVDKWSQLCEGLSAPRKGRIVWRVEHPHGKA